MGKIILLIFALQFLLSIHQISVSTRSASYISDDESDEGQSSDEENPSDSDNEYESETENESETESDNDKEPSHFNCIIFGDQGCNATCSSIASLYSTDSQGTCDSSQICQCTLPNRTPAATWDNKFQKKDISESLLQKITKDVKLRKGVNEILFEFPRTIAETIQQLREKYPKIKEFDKLKPNDKLKMPVSKYIHEKGRLDHKSLRKYLAAQIRNSLKKGDFSIDDVDYKANVESFLEGDDPILPIVVNDKNFAKFLSKLFPKDLIEETSEKNLKVYEEIPDLVESTVIEQFVKYLKNKKKSDKKDEKKSKKQDKKKSEKKDEKKSKKQDEKKSEKKTKKKDTQKSGKKSDKNSNEKESSSTNNKDKLSTPQLDNFTSINDYQTLNRNWKTDNVELTLTKNKDGAIKVDWKKYDTKVVLHKQNDGTIKQNWEFGPATTIKLDLYKNGTIKQYWKVGKKTWEYSKSANGSVKSTGDVTKKDVAIYKHDIRSWCEENVKLFNINDCIIYNKS